MTVKEWRRYWRQRKRHDRTVRNIHKAFAPTRAQAISMLPIAIWRVVNMPASVLVRVAVGFAIIGTASWWMPALLGFHLPR